MSMRTTATRLTRAVRAARPTAPRSQVVARRWNSSSGHKAPGSDTPWLLGSAAFFIPLGGWVIYRGQTEHAGGHAHPKEDQSHNTKQVDQHGRVGIETQFQEAEEDKNEGKAEGNTGGASNAENAPGVDQEKQAAEQAELIDSPKEAKAVEEQGSEVAKKAAAKAGGSGEKPDNEPPAPKADSKEESPDDKESASADSGEGDAPSEEAIKASIKQAEGAAVPRVAMEKEAE